MSSVQLTAEKSCPWPRSLAESQCPVPLNGCDSALHGSCAPLSPWQRSSLRTPSLEAKRSSRTLSMASRCALPLPSHSSGYMGTGRCVHVSVDDLLDLFLSEVVLDGRPQRLDKLFSPLGDLVVSGNDVST